MLGAGAVLSAFYLGSNQGRVVQCPLHGIPDHGLNHRGLHAASDVWHYNVLKYRAETAVACTTLAVAGATHSAFALSAAQSSVDKQILMLAVARTLLPLLRESSLGCLE